jgi:hypothetical protein
MMFFEKPIAIQSSKIEGIYTDSALQGLLNNVSTHPSGGVIPKADISISKTYVSGKDLMSFNAFAVDAGIAAFSSSGAISTISTPTAATPMLNYPYDVRIELLLTQ